MRKYIVGYKDPKWKRFELEWCLQEFDSREDAQHKRDEMKRLGFIQTAVKLMKGERKLSDFS